ncbi:hypothetical protein PybrP1_007153 [[Pythium] brassicae (nom. inval.)]|nr:hypothetical protein PybrP1_007153 [[Pythium] brassicae (nom. inval.)]
MALKTSSADAPPGAPKFPVKPQHPHLRTSVAETADFLHTLRARSLLDYTFMREFSLARTKPVPERSLSKLSASSVYSMRMAQLSLEEQGRTFAGRQQWLMKPEPLEAEEPALSSRDSSVVVSKSSDDVRAPSPASREQPAHRNATRFKRTRRLKAASNSSTSKNESSLAVSCFPTLWGDSAGSHVATTTTTKSVRSTGVSRHPSRPAEPTSRGATPHAPPVVACEDPTASDLRKCHPGAVVAEHHGFLSEQEIPALMATTGYSRTELYALWARFKALCSLSRGPEGIDRATFHRGIPHLSVEDDFFVDRVFAILDADGSGILEWQEFVDALSSLERGDVAKRVDFLFRVYDLNGDGTIHRSEATQFFLASLLVAPSGEAESVARHFVDKIFAAAGCGDKDAMRIDGAMAYMHRHPDADIYSLFGRTMVAGRQLPLVPAASPGQQTAATADSFSE